MVFFGILFAFFAIALWRLQLILSGIDRIEALLTTEEPARDIEFFTNIGGIKTRVVHMFLKVSQELPMLIEIKDKFGNPAQVEGAPIWALDNPALGTLLVAEDGMSAKLTPAGQIGAFKVQVSADADLGEGVKSIIGELDVELLAGEAVSVAISAGNPVDL